MFAHLNSMLKPAGIQGMQLLDGMLIVHHGPCTPTDPTVETIKSWKKQDLQKLLWENLTNSFPTDTR
jgi:hypothetical protein